jgi:hypothetical protein
MIYCVVPQALEGDLLEKLTEYYRDDPNVEVIVDRRAQGGEPGTHESHSEKRRQRVKGTFPPIGPST